MTDVNLVSGASGFLEADFNQIKDIIQDGGVNAILTSINQTTTTGNALSVTRDLALASTDSPVVSITQDNTGDDQSALNIQQDGSGNYITAGNFVITSDGNVGIGITSPASLLSVAATGNSVDAELRLEGTNSGGSSAADSIIASTSLDGGTSSGLIFKTRDVGGTISEKMRILNIGNVGIGTATPVSKLHIEGANFNTSGIRQYRTSNTQGWNWIISSGNEYILREGDILTAADYFIVDNTGNVTITGTVKIGAYTLPATDGTNGQVLMTNGSGVLTWTTP